MKRSLLMALIALAMMPEAHAQREPASAACEAEVYGWTSKDLKKVTRQELSRSFCADSNAVIDQIAPCLEDAYEWLSNVPQKGRRVELAFLTCSNVVQASEKTEYLLFDVNTATRASSCLQKAWDQNGGLANGERYQKAAETCLEVLAVAPEEHAEHQDEVAPPNQEEQTPAEPEIGDEDAIGPLF